MLCLKPKTKLSNRGDTIVEVMITLAVLGLAFSVGFSIANNSLMQTRNAQEHSEALQLLSSQVELVRANVNGGSSSVFVTGSPFCVDSSGTVQPISDINHPPAACYQGTEQVTDANGNHNLYSLSVTYRQTQANGAGQDIFTFQATWPGIGQYGTQKEQITYKIHNLGS